MKKYRSLDYADNVTLLRRKGYAYLTFYDERPIPNEELRGEYGYEKVLFREAIPSLKPQADDGIHVYCFPIDSEETIIKLDSDDISYQVAESYY